MPRAGFDLATPVFEWCKTIQASDEFVPRNPSNSGGSNKNINLPGYE